jgi:glycopeptide antibiotics resistance protein
MRCVPRLRLSTPLLGTIVYLCFVVVILVLPTSHPHPRRGYLGEYHLRLGRRLVADIAVNIAIFTPLGFGLYRSLEGRAMSSAARVTLVTVAAGLFSLGMETVQFWLPARYSSIVDVGTNTAGALLGALAARSGRAR